MRELTLSRAIELAALAVAEKGADYVYRKPELGVLDDGPLCRYAHGDKPGCIVGNVFHRNGATMEQVQELDGRGSIGLIPQSTFPRTEAANHFLQILQSNQDFGTAWGSALSHALDSAATAGHIKD